MSAGEQAMSGFQPDRQGWERLLAAIDRKDAPAFVQFLTPQAQFRFGNGPAVTGRAHIARAVADFFGMIAGCRHELLATWVGPQTAVGEGRVTYRLASGAQVTVPFVNVFELEGDLIAAYRIYIDNGPLLAAHADAHGARTS